MVNMVLSSLRFTFTKQLSSFVDRLATFFRFTRVITYSNTPRLYSQWLNSVIYWLINHCTDRARTGVTSFGRQFDFHDVIYHKRHCNVDNRRRNVVLQLLDVQIIRKNMRFSLNNGCGKF